MRIMKKFLTGSLWLLTVLDPTFLLASDCRLALAQQTPVLQVSPLTYMDLESAVDLESAIWGADMAASAEMLKSRIDVFSGGQLKLSIDGQLVGLLNVQKINAKNLVVLENTNHASQAGAWADFTDEGFIVSSHEPDGDAFFMLNITTQIPTSHVKGISRSLLGETLIRNLIQVVKDQKIKHIYGITRLNGFASYKSNHPTLETTTAISEYLDQVNTGIIRDPALSFHLRMGAKLVRPVANAMPEDDDSQGYGALIVYKIP